MNIKVKYYHRLALFAAVLYTIAAYPHSAFMSARAGPAIKVEHSVPPKAKRGEPKVILCLGDSLTAGYGLDKSQAYPALLQEKIDHLGWNFQVINAGLSGETTAGGLRRLDWFLKRKIDVLILALGGNDALRGIALDSTEKNLDEIMTRTQMKYSGVKIVLSGMLIPPNWGTDYPIKFRAIFPEIAKKHKAQLIPFLLEGVGGNPQLNFPDGIHPTAEGHQIVAENVWKVLKPILASMS
jgi:acyl-CoA thioesterase-1